MVVAAWPDTAWLLIPGTAARLHVKLLTGRLKVTV